MTLAWSGAPDLPQVPFGRLFRRLDRPVPDGAEIVTAYTDGQVTLRSNRAKIGYHEAADLSGFSGVEVGDFVVHGLDILRGSVGIADSSGAITAVCAVCEPIADLDPRYVAHAIRTQAKFGFTRALARGIREGGADFRRWGTLAELPIPMPPIEYQRAVCNYLDRETARIDTLIEEQQRLIELLRERRKAVVEQAVFSGLDALPTVSNDEPWLPPTPSHWLVLQLGFVSATLAGWAFPSDGFSAEEDQTRLLRGVNVKPGRIDWTDTVYWDTEAAPIPREFDLEIGDLVFGMDRPFVGGGVRVAAVSAEDLPALLLQRVMRIRPNDEAGRGYMRYVMSTDAFFNYLQPLFTGVSVPHVSEWQVRKFKMPVPPPDEQRNIVAHLDEQTAKIDALIVETDRFIELARERRSALITAAVTGHVDVREMV
ncbi:restriction endonuclease subunit S [Frankia sp. AgPm24]|uniref:restriction endonuclease subunit S n=1 Tax=Frankia sp. AgPm24 TaxID=631128 RepID=UPI00200EB8B6|nr:restriction endonuclease subunit S [Frankia sp. AgPm24]MCK9923351.1 restriction endonuclease subunit S [Frankia sp. AgPm24]